MALFPLSWISETIHVTAENPFEATVEWTDDTVIVTAVFETDTTAFCAPDISGLLECSSSSPFDVGTVADANCRPFPNEHITYCGWLLTMVCWTVAVGTVVVDALDDLACSGLGIRQIVFEISLLLA